MCFNCGNCQQEHPFTIDDSMDNEIATRGLTCGFTKGLDSHGTL